MFLKLSVSLGLLFIFTVAVAGQRKIDGVYAGIVNGRATYLPKPEYPPEARDFCARGKVEIEVLIDEKGDVSEARAISGDELLYDASLKAVKKAKFATYNDLGAVKTKGIIVYNFDPFAPKCISVGIVNKRAVSLPVPPTGNIIHPRHLRLTKEEIVAVQIIVDMSGKVTTTRVLSGHPLLRGVCSAAAQQAKFSPVSITIPPVKALLVYKFKPDGSVETNIDGDDKAVIGTAVNLVEPPPSSCTCAGLSGNVLVEAFTNEQGNVVKAKAYAGHPILRNISEKAALESKFLPTNTKAKIYLVYNFEAAGKYSARIVNIEIKKVEIEK